MINFSFITKLLEALASHTAKSAAPFALQEVAALTQFAVDCLKMELDFNQTKEERSVNQQLAINDLKAFLEACKVEGIQLITDLPGIILSTGADGLMSAFGFDKNAH